MSESSGLLSNEELLNVLSLTLDPVAVHIGEDAVIQFANDAMLKVWDKSKSVIGKSLEDALPELKGQPFIDQFAKVWREGITIAGTNTRAEIEVNGVLQAYYFDYEYRAIKNNEGKTYCILHLAKDVTERVKSLEKEQVMIEELTAINEELSASNEEINASNEELSESRQQLMDLYESLTTSNNRFRSIVSQAPVGMCIIRADDLFITDVNEAYLELVGKPRELFANQTIWQAVPEAAEAYAPVMNGVISTGIPFHAKEHELYLIRNRVSEQVFVDFVYEPMKNDSGVYAIMVLAIEVTDKVLARRKVEEMEERIRLAVEASDIGTFDLDYASRYVAGSDRFYNIFGFDAPVSWDNLINRVHPEDQINRLTAHQELIENGRMFYEARMLFPDNSTHWVRVHGNIKKDNNGKPVRLLGTALDITEVKRLEQQKDDFISIASHELKTPLTSLKASLQLLERLKGDFASPMLPRLIDQSVKSMQKVSTLVDDLLNVSRTKAMALQLNKTDVKVSELIDNCCSHIRVAGKYTLTFEGDRDLTIYADEHAIDQVIVNLVNNAVKYAPDSFEIILKAERLPGEVKISVTDKGPGIAPDKIPHLFDRYYQAKTDGFNNSGLGLGLFICSEIVNKHGGRIGVDTKRGQGSIFWFTIPA